MNASVAQALADALDHHRRGRLSEAEAGYRRVLEKAPDQPDALHRLGIIAHQLGRHDLALQLIERAIAANPANAAYCNDAGIVLHALRRHEDAIARYREALALEPNYPKAHNGIGIVRNDEGRLDDAEESFRLALSLAPDYAPAQNNLANVLRARGQHSEAVRIYREALALRPDSADLWYNLGNAHADQRAFDEAASAFRKALSLRPDFADARARIGDALFALGQADSAVTNFAQALAVTQAPDTIAGFVRSFVAAELRHVDDHVRRAALRALSTPWARPAELAAACIRVLARTRAIRRCVEHAWSAWPSRLGFRELFGADAGVLFADPLLRVLLESTPVCDLPMERFLTLARSALLRAASGNTDVGGDAVLAFQCALARQCFINDYVFAYDDDEIAQATGLRDRLVASLARGEMPPPIDVAVVAAYFPLDSLSRDGALLSRASPQPLAGLLAQQLVEPQEERAARARIPCLTTVDDGVSARVRQQYEEHPYPRWVKLPPPGLASSAETNGGGRFPIALLEASRQASGLDILIAGCGTGQESIEFAQAFPRARVLAIDLSLASLAYAKRQAHALHVANVEHAQADITRLASLGQRFDVISSVGVLHHLADPQRGMRGLASMLVPGGHMLIGLYSERGRRDVVAARAFIAERAYRATADDIRRCRQALISADRDEFSPLASRDDFYVTAECRDLLFHVEEHRFTLPRIRRCLDALGLAFEGFLLASRTAKRYAERFGPDAVIGDLDHFDAFEAEFPDAFVGMYIFWVRKGS